MNDYSSTSEESSSNSSEEYIKKQNFPIGSPSGTSIRNIHTIMKSNASSITSGSTEFCVELCAGLEIIKENSKELYEDNSKEIVSNETTELINPDLNTNSINLAHSGDEKIEETDIGNLVPKVPKPKNLFTAQLSIHQDAEVVKDSYSTFFENLFALYQKEIDLKEKLYADDQFTKELIQLMEKVEDELSRPKSKKSKAKHKNMFKKLFKRKQSDAKTDTSLSSEGSSLIFDSSKSNSIKYKHELADVLNNQKRNVSSCCNP